MARKFLFDPESHGHYLDGVPGVNPFTDYKSPQEIAEAEQAAIARQLARLARIGIDPTWHAVSIRERELYPACVYGQWSHKYLEDTNCEYWTGWIYSPFLCAKCILWYDEVGAFTPDGLPVCRICFPGEPVISDGVVVIRRPRRWMQDLHHKWDDEDEDWRENYEEMIAETALEKEKWLRK